jgi:hypothetical protein
MAEAVILHEGIRVAVRAFQEAGVEIFAVDWDEKPWWHIAIGLKGLLAFVGVEIVSEGRKSFAFDLASRDELISEAAYASATPILCTVDVDKLRLATGADASEYCEFLDLSTDAEWRPSLAHVEAQVVVSEWELHDMAIKFARDELRSEGYSVHSTTGKTSKIPHILASRNGTPLHVFVRGYRYPQLPNIIDDHEARFVEACLTEAESFNADLMIARVRIMSWLQDVDSATPLPIIRGKKYLCKLIWRQLRATSPRALH